jgi:formylglycine-generating enzyme required for sulfatase activity
MRARAAGKALLLVAATCGLPTVACGERSLPPAGEVRIGVDTDALLPPGPGEPPPANAPLFDRLRVELFAPGQTVPCDGCTREFGLDHRTVLEGRASFGVVPPVGHSGYVARVRLFRSVGASTPEPRATSTIEAVIALPTTSADGIKDVHVELMTSSLGAPLGTLADPAPPLPGPAKGGMAGTFAQSYVRDCSAPPHEGEVCVPGGAYWMGDLSVGKTYGNTPSERLVVVSPFFMSATEVTVGQWRASGVPAPGNVLAHETDPTCPYTLAKGAAESFPLGCVTRPAALTYCDTKGGTLPSEAQWEYVEGARRSAFAVWGNDPARCTDAIYARTTDAMPTDQTGECLLLGKGPAPVGTGQLDYLTLPTGSIHDVVGNLSEWMADAWAKQGTGCWKDAVMFDPLCLSTTSGATKDYTVRGGSYLVPTSQLRAAIRSDVSAKGNPFAQSIGFRCVRPDGP